MDRTRLWVFDPTHHGLPLVRKVETSKKGDDQKILLCSAVGDALEFGKYFWFIFQGGGKGSGCGSGVSVTGGLALHATFLLYYPALS